MLLSTIARLSEASDVLTIRRGVVAFAAAHGFGACFFVVPIARHSEQGRVLSNVGFDERWARAYRRGLSRIDPLPEIGLALGKPFRWSQAGLLHPLTNRQQRYLAILDRCGMRDGIAMAAYGAGARAALVGFGHHPDLENVPISTVLKLQLMVQSTFHRYCLLTAPEFSRDQELSGRERDVLFWLTQGKSNTTIGAILQISPATVDTYVRRVFKKLGVSDRAGASMAAVQYGYVISGEYRRQPQTDLEA